MHRHARRGTEASRLVTTATRPEDGPRPDPSPRGAVVGHRIGITLVRSAWNTRVLGAWRVPGTGPVILAGNHSHNVDGPLVIGTSPRPVHFLVKREAFVGPAGAAMRALGQIAVDRGSADRGAVADTLAVLRAGGVIGMFPEGSRGAGDFAALRSGLAWFALRSGAAVVPVAVLGSSERRSRVLPGLPPLRGRLDVVYGEPFHAGDGSGRRTRAALDTAAEQVRERLAAHLASARTLTAR
ncbi:1-acyl-sn-glycerol-3-phosphate acyltransferase [Streptomyces sp. ventii]|uniref:1-acyl-sn-glycerol-3-phosphate acyltransferase n=1 Tax=Streptomyces spiramenti TaxID=2720606 RepID=A0ABX1AL58_9ACTN|nr:1-acyl-sn-glycerol-3-phosphate acyltransferase [Streptomyces spiramenti]